MLCGEVALLQISVTLGQGTLVSGFLVPIAHCTLHDHSRDESVGMVEPHVKYDGVIMYERLIHDYTIILHVRLHHSNDFSIRMAEAQPLPF